MGPRHDAVSNHSVRLPVFSKESTVSTEPPGARCRILPFAPKPQPVATSSIDARYLYSLREKRRQELAGVQRRVLAFPRPEERLQDAVLESLRFRWERPEE
jgi:hypothetical protein